jgi:hypothetical protein
MASSMTTARSTAKSLAALSYTPEAEQGCDLLDRRVELGSADPSVRHATNITWREYRETPLEVASA